MAELGTPVADLTTRYLTSLRSRVPFAATLTRNGSAPVVVISVCRHATGHDNRVSRKTPRLILMQEGQGGGEDRAGAGGGDAKGAGGTGRRTVPRKKGGPPKEAAP
jgi:hypothetical protein